LEDIRLFYLEMIIKSSVQMTRWRERRINTRSRNTLTLSRLFIVYLFTIEGNRYFI